MFLLFFSLILNLITVFKSSFLIHISVLFLFCFWLLDLLENWNSVIIFPQLFKSCLSIFNSQWLLIHTNQREKLCLYPQFFIAFSSNVFTLFSFMTLHNKRPGIYHHIIIFSIAVYVVRKLLWIIKRLICGNFNHVFKVFKGVYYARSSFLPSSYTEKMCQFKKWYGFIWNEKII